MACSVCREIGHKKPNCPVVKEEKQEQQKQLITILQTIPLILSNPLFQTFLWLEFSKRNENANLLNNLIATAEIVPAIDLNLPQGVVLGAMLDKTEDSIALWNDIKDWIFDFSLPELPSKEEVALETITKTGDIAGTIGRNPLVELFFPTWSEIFKETEIASEIAEGKRDEEGKII